MKPSEQSTHTVDKVRRDFIANVSHELRTPLTVFRGYLEILLEDAKIDVSTLKDVLGQMQDQTERMQVLVEDLLLLSRLESLELSDEQLQPVHVARLLHDIHKDALILSGKKNHQFMVSVDEALMLNGQTDELESAFANIISNAVAYTQAGACIHIKWYREGKKAIFAVHDNGPGIAPQHLSRLTQRFYRVDKARSRAVNDTGTGLGLAIVKHVMLRHDAELFIDSELGVGSVFRCVFSGV